MILCLETATPTCSVALNDGSKTLALRECKGQNAHSEKITLFIKEVMDEVGIGYSQLDAVAVSKGPGSYTGLRIGVSTAKGVCYAAGLPLMAIDTLQAMAWGMRERLGVDCFLGDILVPMIDARRMEVYCAMYEGTLALKKETQALVVDAHSFDEYIPKHRLWLFGDGAPKLKPLFEEVPTISVIEDFSPSASYMAALSDRALKAKDFVDVAYFEPFYLKDFVAAKPHVKGLE